MKKTARFSDFLGIIAAGKKEQLDIIRRQPHLLRGVLHALQPEHRVAYADKKRLRRL